MSLLLVALAVVVVYRLRRRITSRVRALVLVAAILGLNLALGTPAQAQTDCGVAPTPERPGAGMVGAIDPPQGNGEKDSPYLLYGYAGMVWHTYDDNCRPRSGVPASPRATFDTWAGNQLFDIAKNLVGATNALHYTLLNGGVLGGLNQQIEAASRAVFNNIYGQLVSLALLILAVILFRHIWRGDLATVTKRGLFAIGGMWLAASSLVLVSNFSRIDTTIIDTTNGIQAGFVDPSENRIVRDVLPTDLHESVVYENWLRGEFGSPDSPQAKDLGHPLLNAQAWTWEDLRNGKDADNTAEQAKKDQYKQIYTQLGPAKGYFQGTDGSRIGAGFLALLEAIAYSLFPLLAKIGIVLAQLLLRILALTVPIIGLVAIVHHDILRRVGKAAGVIAFNVIVLASLAGVHTLFLHLILQPIHGIRPGAAPADITQSPSPMITITLAGLLTVILLKYGRPILRTKQVVGAAATIVSAPIITVPSGTNSGGRRRKRSGSQQITDDANGGNAPPRPEGNVSQAAQRNVEGASAPRQPVERKPDRSGRGFTPRGKKITWEENAAANDGIPRCVNCEVPVEPQARGQRGVPVPANAGQTDHIIPQSKGGPGEPSNGQLLCRVCNRKKSDQYPWP